MRPSLLLLLAGAVSAGASVVRPRMEQLEDPVVTTENGIVRGEVVTSVNGKPYKRFVGIPYATPPIGELRFKAPLPAANWTGVRDALEFGPRCTQLTGGSEDCLYVNVYVPLTSDSSPLAVMFHIYGGGFSAGSSTFISPDFLVEDGVVVVTFNYRLGPFGFLSLQNDDIPGNAGLKDQLLALKWVQRNIAAFGGDPARVTVFGASAGGGSSSLLFLSPAAKGLFRGAAMESGVALAPWAIEPKPRIVAYQLGSALGFQSQGDNTTDEDTRLAAFLRAADAGDLQAAQVEGSGSGIITKYPPVVEPSSDSALITELPEDTLKNGGYNQVPFLVGVTSGEAEWIATIFLRLDLLPAAEARQIFLNVVAQQIPLPTEEERMEAAKQAENFYYGGEGFNANYTQIASDVYSDLLFIRPAYEFARRVLNSSSLPVYFYYFDYDGYGATEYGMGHAMEVNYMLPSTLKPNRNLTSNDWKVTQQLAELWTNFGKYGEPTPDGSTMTWERFTEDTDSYLDMKLEFVTQQYFLKDRMAFWRDLLHF